MALEQGDGRPNGYRVNRPAQNQSYHKITLRVGAFNPAPAVWAGVERPHIHIAYTYDKRPGCCRRRYGRGLPKRLTPYPLPTPRCSGGRVSRARRVRLTARRTRRRPALERGFRTAVKVGYT